MRLLTLLPGSKESPIRCELQFVEVGHTSPYEITSYAWGRPPQPQETVWIAGAPVAIGVNLHYALRRFRCANKPRVLWTDALCINQADLAEKSSQVAMMTDKYTHCERALILLEETNWIPPVPDGWRVSPGLLELARTQSPFQCMRLLSYNRCLPSVLSELSIDRSDVDASTVAGHEAREQETFCLQYWLLACQIGSLIASEWYVPHHDQNHFVLAAEQW